MVIGPDVRQAIAAHAEAEAPNEACGLLVIRDGVAERYEPGENVAASPYRFELRPGSPETPFLEDEAGVEVGLVHSHVSSPAYPSKTDVENARDGWPDRPFLIYCVRERDLAAFRIGRDGQIATLELATRR